MQQLPIFLRAFAERRRAAQLHRLVAAGSTALD
jgi:hypothetical protein